MKAKRPAAKPKPFSAKQHADAALRFAVEAARLASATRCHNLAILDVRELSPVTDYLVLATGTSARQMKAVADQLEELGETMKYGAVASAGREGGESNWIAIDFFNVVVHLFDQEARMYYDLDGLWGDAPKVEFEAAEPVGAKR